MDDFFNWIDNAKLTHLGRGELLKLFIILEKESSVSMSRLCEFSNTQVSERIRDFCKIENNFIHFDGKNFTKKNSSIEKMKNQDSDHYYPVLTSDKLILSDEYQGLFPLKEKNKFFIVSHHLIKQIEKKIPSDKVQSVMNAVYQSVVKMTPQMIPDVENMPSFIKRMVDQQIEKMNSQNDSSNHDDWVNSLLSIKNKKTSIVSVCKKYQA